MHPACLLWLSTLHTQSCLPASGQLLKPLGSAASRMWCPSASCARGGHLRYPRSVLEEGTSSIPGASWPSCRDGQLSAATCFSGSAPSSLSVKRGRALPLAVSPFCQEAHFTSCCFCDWWTWSSLSATQLACSLYSTLYCNFRKQGCM